MMQAEDVTRITDTLMSDTASQAALRQTYKGASSKLNELISASVGTEADTYVVGLNYDFDWFARRYATSLGERLVGVACFNSRPMRYPGPDGERMFSSERLNFAEKPTRPPAVVVIFLAIASDEIEIMALMSMVAKQSGDAKVIIACAIEAQGVGEAAQPWLEEFGLPKPEIVSLRSLEGDLRSARDGLYDRIDNRPQKMAPLMPIWIAERVFGPMPEHMREQYALKD